MPKERLDKILVDRGLAQTRARAQARILAGEVLVREERIDKPGQLIDSESEIRLKGESLRYVGRGGLKLEAALKAFDVDVSEKTCIDVGASTGGFTDCLLQHGAKKVWAVDVGHNQIAWRLRQDPRVVVIENFNARDLDPTSFPSLFDIGTIDVSFISLTKILPALRKCLADEGDCIALIKPQFEVGKGEVGRGGIVSDPAKHRRVLDEITEFAAANRMNAISLIDSPITGADGNREFLLHLKRESASGVISETIRASIDLLTQKKPGPSENG